MFLGTGFWSHFGYGGFSSQLDDILKQPNITIDQILSEQTILNELRGQGATQFSKFLTDNPEKLKNLLDYIIVEPNQQDSADTQFQFPFVTSQVFNMNMNGVVDYLFNENNDDANGEDQFQSCDDEQEENDDLNKKQSDPAQEGVEKDQKDEQTKEEQQPEDSDNKEKNGDEKAVDTKEENSSPSSQIEKQQQDSEQVASPQESDLSTQSQESPQPSVVQKVVINGTYLLGYALAFFEKLEPLNPTLTGYFQKFFQSLVTQSGHLSKFLTKQGKEKEFIQNITRHVENRSVGDIINRIISLEGLDAQQESKVQINFKVNLVNHLVETFLQSEESEVLEGIDYIFNEYLNGTTQNQTENQDVNQILISSDFIESLSNKIKELNKINQNLMVYPVNLLNNIIQVLLNNIEQQRDNEQDDIDIVNTQNQLDEIADGLLNKFNQYFKNFVEIINGLNQKKQNFSNKETIVPFGIVNLQLVEIFVKLFRLQAANVNQAIVASGFLQIIPPLLIKYQWNNIFHTYCDKIYNEIYQSGNLKVINHVLNETQLIPLVTEYLEKEFQQDDNQSRSGFYGYFSQFIDRIQGVIQKRQINDLQYEKELQLFQQTQAQLKKIESIELGENDNKDNNNEDEYSEEQKNSEDKNLFEDNFHDANSGENHNYKYEKETNGYDDEEQIDEEIEEPQNNQNNDKANNLQIDENNDFTGKNFWKMNFQIEDKSFFDDLLNEN